MIKAHKRKWGFRDPKGIWHEHEIVIYYNPSGENPWDRLVINVPEEIALTTGRNTVTAESAEKAMEKLNSLKEDHMEIVAPKEKTKIIRFLIRMSPRDYDEISISVEHQVLWMVKQEGRKYKLEEEDGSSCNSDFDPVRDKNGWMQWMHWTQAREDFFINFERNLRNLSEKFEQFYTEKYPKDADDLGRAIDSGLIIAPFEKTGSLLTEGNKDNKNQNA